MKELLTTEVEQLQCVGAGVAISKGAEKDYYAFGKAHLDYGIDITEKSVFDIASISKLFTSTLVFKLIEEEKLSLNSPVTDLLKDLPVQWKGVTVRHLLSHSSGLPSYTSTAQYWKETRLDVSKERILEYVIDQDLSFAPGAKWEYNNTAYYLLGLMVEAIEQQSFFTVVQNKLFTPLGITSIYPTNHYVIIPHRVNGYMKTDDGFRPAEYYSHAGTFSAGGFSANLTSFLAFEKALFEGKIISKNSLEQLLTPFPFSDKESVRALSFKMCHGLFLFQYRGKKIFGHAGSIMGFSSAYLRVYEDDIAMIIAVNTQDIDAMVLTNILYKVYDAL